MKKLAFVGMAFCLSFQSHAGSITVQELESKLAKHKDILESAPEEGQVIRKVESRYYDRSYREAGQEKYYGSDRTCDHRLVATYIMHERTSESIYLTYQVDLKYRFLDEKSYCTNYLDKNHKFPFFVRKDDISVEKFLKGQLEGLSQVKVFESSHQGHTVFKISGKSKNGYGDPMYREMILRTDRTLMANPAIETVKVKQTDGLDFTIRSTYTIE